MREAFALQKLLTFCQQKYWHILDINVWNLNETLTNDVVNFEQLCPGLFLVNFAWLSALSGSLHLKMIYNVILING